jgi:hypothetical protein
MSGGTPIVVSMAIAVMHFHLVLPGQRAFHANRAVRTRSGEAVAVLKNLHPRNMPISGFTTGAPTSPPAAPESHHIRALLGENGRDARFQDARLLSGNRLQGVAEIVRGRNRSK